MTNENYYNANKIKKQIKELTKAKNDLVFFNKLNVNENNVSIIIEALRDKIFSLEKKFDCLDDNNKNIEKSNAQKIIDMINNGELPPLSKINKDEKVFGLKFLDWSFWIG